MKNGLKKIGIFLLLVVYVMVFSMPLAQAYIDPSATTLLIQVISGIAIAVASVVVIFWRKAKKKVKEKTGIDFDRNKETETDFAAVGRADAATEGSGNIPENEQKKD